MFWAGCELRWRRRSVRWWATSGCVTSAGATVSTSSRFELPLVGGDTPTATLDIGQIGRLLSDHLQPDDPLAGYADRLDDPVLQSGLRGYLSGSLDLVLRTPDTATPSSTTRPTGWGSRGRS